MVLGHDITKGQRTQDVRISQDVSFDTMLLKSETLKGLLRAGFLKPSPIQLQGIPLGKCGFDLLLEAKSGTGKTAVFTVITLEKLDLNIGVQAIILAPTREIAAQISDVITDIGYYYEGLNVAVVMGGIPFQDDVVKFDEQVHIVVGSPGRMRHLITESQINLSSVRLLVLDEADKLMESSFLPDINFIFSLLPKQKQVIMSSATYPEETKTFVTNYLKKAQHVWPDTNSVLLGITQKVTNVPHHSNIVKQTQHRFSVLKKILTKTQFKQCLIFCNYQARVGELHRMLSKDKWPAEQLYGQQEQIARLSALKTLQEYKCRILVSTDLAARGIDAANIDLVINFEPPYDWQTYLHRIGRAGRYGSYGTAITILSEGKESNKFKKTLRDTNIPFDIRNYWNNESFNISDTEDDESVASADVAPETIKVDIKNEDVLWNVITTDPSKQNQVNKREIESFESLCNSLKVTTESNIESFSDLMHSFSVKSNNKCSKQIVTRYKQVKVCKLNIDTDYLKSLETQLTVKRSDHEDISENISEEKHENESNDYSVEKPASIDSIEPPFTKIIDDKEKNSEPYNINKSDCDLHDEVPQNDTNDLYKCAKPITTTKNLYFRSNSEEIEVNQALIDAGLPTSFGKKTKSKPKKVNDKHSYHKESHDSNNNDDITKWEKPKDQQKQKEFVNNKIQLKKHIHQRSKMVDEFDQSDTNEETDQPEYSTKIRYMKQPETKSRRYIKQRSNAQYYQNNLNEHFVYQTQNRNKEFDIWYSKLRRHTQYIQYALYVEELNTY